MQKLLSAIRTFIQNDTNMQMFMGINGPFEWMPQGDPVVALPYMTVQHIGGTPLWQGFTTAYVARPRIRFTLWDRDSERVKTNAEYFCTKMDTGTLTLMNGTASSTTESCRLPIRIEEPRLLPARVSDNGIRVFGCIAEYRFNVQRTRGQ